jgi:hypothetical protein
MTPFIAVARSFDFAPDLGPFLATVFSVLIFLLALLMILGLIVFPWWVRRIMHDVERLRKIAKDAELRHVSEQAVQLALMRQQIAELQSLNAKLLGAEIAREQA